MKRWITFGMYSMFAQGKRIDWDKILDEVKASNVFSGLSLHLLSPWGQHPDEAFYPWPFQGNKFNLTKVNSEWYATLKVMLLALLHRGMDVELGLGDRYFINKWIKYLPFKPHPFRNNNIGIDWGGSDKPLYDGITFGPVKFHLLDWDNGYKPVGKIGEVWAEYIGRVLDTIKECRQVYPVRGRIAWKRVNETRGGDNIASSSGDRHELHNYIRDEAKKRGLKQGPKFKAFNDYNAVGSNPDSQFRGAYKGTIGAPMQASAIEVHNVGIQAGNSRAWEHFIHTLGFNPAKFVASTDGVMISEGHIQACKNLIKSPIVHIDLKQEEANFPQHTWNKKNMTKNFENFFGPFRDELVK
jgi:hypothetical protein